jgi:hypothetical protein
MSTLPQAADFVIAGGGSATNAVSAITLSVLAVWGVT